MRFPLTVVFAFLSSAIVAAQQPVEDTLDSLLHSIGWTRDSLGFEYRSSWVRQPDIQHIPGLLRFFPDLHQSPLRIYDFARTFPSVAQHYLDTAYRNRKSDGVYKLFYFTVVDRLLTGFRSYGANTQTRLPSGLDGNQILAAVWDRAGRLPFRPSFGGAYTDTPAPWYAFVQQIDSVLPPPVRTSVFLLLHNIATALQWYHIALRHLSADLQARITKIRDLHRTQGDGTVFYPEIDDAYAAIDWHSYCYAALQCIEAVERFVRNTDTIPFKLPPFVASLQSPFGEIIISGPGDDTIQTTNPFIIIDFGGDDVYRGSPAGAQVPVNPLSLLIDLGGNDRYRATAVSLGSAILGIGLLWDHSGSDWYEGGNITQGCGQLGFGILVDQLGNDHYRGAEMAQGCGFWGVGMLLDYDGNDEYTILGNGQGDGEMSGIGILIDGNGNDHYFAEPWADRYDRGDYHSGYRVNVSNAQGFGGGRRGDGSDGHSWAGGLGCLIDLAGDDQYTAGNWAQGTGYWFGTGILWDQSGNDYYRSCYFTQASGAHFAVGALIDNAGNDRYELFETMGAALGYGWDFTIALFVDKEGDDFYQAKRIALGTAQIRSQAFFFDLSGNDTYRLLDTLNLCGAAPPYRYYTEFDPTLAYFYWNRSIGLFLDLGGDDHYEYPVQPLKSTYPRNNAQWFSPPLNDPKRGRENYGIGIDRSSGFLRPFSLIR